MIIYVKRDEAYASLKAKVEARIQRSNFVLRKNVVGHPQVEWSLEQWGIPCMDWNMQRWGIQKVQLLDVDMMNTE